MKLQNETITILSIKDISNELNDKNGYKVFMPTEFMHAMYDQGGGAGLRDFWDRWCTNPV